MTSRTYIIPAHSHESLGTQIGCICWLNIACIANSSAVHIAAQCCRYTLDERVSTQTFTRLRVCVCVCGRSLGGGIGKVMISIDICLSIGAVHVRPSLGAGALNRNAPECLVPRVPRAYTCICTCTAATHTHTHTMHQTPLRSYTHTQAPVYETKNAHAHKHVE